MTEADSTSDDVVEPGLRMVWWDPEFVADPVTQWGQLSGAVHRLLIVFDGLERAAGRRAVTKGFNELTFYLENYFVRVYELRERAVALVEGLSGLKLGTTKDPVRRVKTLSRLEQQLPEVVQPFSALLQLLDPDVSIRNDQTHRQYIDLQLVVSAHDMYEPETVLLETEDTNAGIVVRRVIRRDIKKLALEHAQKALNIRDATWRLLDVAHTIIMRTA